MDQENRSSNRKYFPTTPRSKPSKLGVVTYKSNYASPVYTCKINDDFTLTRLDTNKLYFAVSSFVDAVENEVWKKREEKIFNAAVQTPTKLPKLQTGMDLEIPVEPNNPTSPNKTKVAEQQTAPQPKTPTVTPNAGKKRIGMISLFGLSF